jgi:hypothetical protein
MLPSPGLLNLTIARESWAAAMDEINTKAQVKPTILLHNLVMFDGI